MEIHYKTKKLKKICTDYEEAKKKYNTVMAEKIGYAIMVINSAPSVDFIIKNKICRCHKLKNNRKDEYSMHLEEPYRLIFEEEDKILKLKEVKIISIEDYH